MTRLTTQDYFTLAWSRPAAFGRRPTVSGGEPSTVRRGEPSIVQRQAIHAVGRFDRAGAHVYLFDPMASNTADKTNKPVDFETAMRDLEAIVERLERGDLPLEQSLAEFERGILLTRTCQTALKDAEQKVEILLKRAGDPAGGPTAGERGTGFGAADIEPFIPDES